MAADRIVYVRILPEKVQVQQPNRLRASHIPHSFSSSDQQVAGLSPAGYTNFEGCLRTFRSGYSAHSAFQIGLKSNWGTAPQVTAEFPQSYSASFFNSSGEYGWLRPASSARTFLTCSAVTMEALLPQALRI